MNRLLLLPCFVLLTLGAITHGSPVKPIERKAVPLPGLESQFTIFECKGGERSCAIAIGNGKSNLGLYVYDPQGNCVAWDDDGMPTAAKGLLGSTYDDLAVEWKPQQKSSYSVEIRNSGNRTNDCKLWVR